MFILRNLCIVKVSEFRVKYMSSCPNLNFSEPIFEFVFFFSEEDFDVFYRLYAYLFQFCSLQTHGTLFFPYRMRELSNYNGVVPQPHLQIVAMVTMQLLGTSTAVHTNVSTVLKNTIVFLTI